MSEDQDQLLKLANLLAKYVIDEKIEIQYKSEELNKHFESYRKNWSLKGTENIHKIIHREKHHTESQIALECGNRHCLQCYYELVTNEWNPNATFCTHGSQIVPKFRRVIMDRYEALIKICVVCEKSKDRMEFALLGTHPNPGCVVCTDCTKENFNLKESHNSCAICKEKFSEESESVFRNILESTMTDAELLEIYGIECNLCHQRLDSRKFEQICTKNCKVCFNCKFEVKPGNCPLGCGEQVSIV
jgi:hypothetical protein